MGTHLAIPILSLTLVGASLSDVDELDNAIKALAGVPASVGRLGTLRALALASARLDERQALVTTLPAGTRVPSAPVQADELKARLARATDQLRVRLAVDGPALGIAERVAERLGDLGYRIGPRPDARTDLELAVTTSLEDAVFDGKLYQVEASIAFTVDEGGKGKSTSGFTERYRYGGTSSDIARKRAVELLADHVDADAIGRLDRRIKGLPDPVETSPGQDR